MIIYSFSHGCCVEEDSLIYQAISQGSKLDYELVSEFEKLIQPPSFDYVIDFKTTPESF